jgi:hypothetical protein
MVGTEAPGGTLVDHVNQPDGVTEQGDGLARARTRMIGRIGNMAYD